MNNLNELFAVVAIMDDGDKILVSPFGLPAVCDGNPLGMAMLEDLAATTSSETPWPVEIRTYGLIANRTKKIHDPANSKPVA
jgi:hypothetical protein